MHHLVTTAAVLEKALAIALKRQEGTSPVEQRSVLRKVEVAANCGCSISGASGKTGALLSTLQWVGTSLPSSYRDRTLLPDAPLSVGGLGVEAPRDKEGCYA